MIRDYNIILLCSHDYNVSISTDSTNEHLNGHKQWGREREGEEGGRDEGRALWSTQLRMMKSKCVYHF